MAEPGKVTNPAKVGDAALGLGCCAGCGCLLLGILLLIIVAFAAGPQTRGRLGAESPPQVGTGGGTTGGTTQGQIDPNATDPNCKDLLAKFGGTDIPHYQVINAAAARWGVSAALVAAIARNESGFNRYATNESGARGMMQIMPGTLAGLIDQRDSRAPRDSLGRLRTDPYDPEVSAYYGAKYLHELQGYSYIGDNVELIAAGYNAGPGAVESGAWRTYSETTTYARNVMSDYQRYLNCLTAETRPQLTTSPTDGSPDAILTNPRINLLAPAQADIQAASQGKLNLSPTMLAAMEQLSQTYSYRVTSIAGGRHTENSYHYRGSALDVDLVDGVAVSDRPEAARQFMERCRAMGAVEVFGPWNDPDGNHWHHIHCAWR